MSPHLTYPRTQQTIATTAMVSGFGYWSGADVHLEFRPADAGTGIVFIRPHRSTEIRIPANVAYREDVPRRTNLARQGERVDMVEHVLAALAGLNIDNCEIYASAPEMPGCDGSSQSFVEALLTAGIEQQSEPRPALKINQTIRVGDADSWIEARPLPSKAAQQVMALQYFLDYGKQSAIGQQSFSLDLSPVTFQGELAKARTFILRSEAEQMQANGQGLRVTTSHLLVFDDNGPVDNPLRYPNECVRHKTLDMVGDLALCGYDLIGEFEAYRTGHRLNAELVRQILSRHALSNVLSNCA